mgnify:CR=1 FL=1
MRHEACASAAAQLALAHDCIARMSRSAPLKNMADWQRSALLQINACKFGHTLASSTMVRSPLPATFLTPSRSQPPEAVR